MFNNYEPLRCGHCAKAFMGRKPADGGSILCPDCVESRALAVVGEGEAVPCSVEEEVAGARGESDGC